MTLNDLCEFTEFTQTAINNSLDEKIEKVIVSELMSDVLTDEDSDNVVLVTGLCTEQAIRTADMIDAPAVVITTGKKITNPMLKIAKDAEISLFSTKLRNYDVCKILAGKF